MNKTEIISEILKLELDMTTAVIKGHKPNEFDEYKEHRIKLKILRKLINI